MRILVVALLLAGCGYSVHFEDCSVECALDTITGCPDGLECGTEGRCRVPGTMESCFLDGSISSSHPSCKDLPTTCGPASSEDCCSTATPIPGGTFNRAYDMGADGAFPDSSHPATVSPFVLDKYEVTVGRFRKFVTAGMGTQTSAPTSGAGARTLNGMPAQGGWDASWSSNLAIDTPNLEIALKCASYPGTWTDAAGANESLPINCITWYEAMAFCIWDGGHLPTDTEMNFASSGGDEQRTYPWSSPPASLIVDCSFANYSGCVGALNRVGSESPKGDGKFGQSDLAGNVWEWELDWYALTFPMPCNDCADLVEPSTQPAGRVDRAGGYSYDGAYLRSSYRGGVTPTPRSYLLGVRCARSMP